MDWLGLGGLEAWSNALRYALCAMLSEFCESGPDGVFDKPHLIMYIQLLHNVSFMSFNGFFADTEE